MNKKVEILFTSEEGHCHGCIGQSASTSSTLQIIGMVLTEYKDGVSKGFTYCYTCAMRRLEHLKNDLMANRDLSK